MITAGIDSGNRNTKVVVLKNGMLAGKGIVATEFDASKASELAYKAALADSGVQASEVAAVIATGSGQARVGFATDRITEISSAARGVYFALPNVKLVIDVGTEVCRAIKLRPGGQVESYEVNDKCASGAGTFIETMALTLQLSIEEMGALSRKHTKTIPINAQCVVFAESEVISLIHQRVEIADIVHSIHNSIAGRISSLVRKLGIADSIVMIGGPSHNIGLVSCMENVLKKAITVPENTDYISALGAASCAAEFIEDRAQTQKDIMNSGMDCTISIDRGVRG